MERWRRYTEPQANALAATNGGNSHNQAWVSANCQPIAAAVSCGAGEQANSRSALRIECSDMA
jgi:hypothetical protein